MSSIIIQYNELVELWHKTEDMAKVMEYILELPSHSQKELIKYIRMNIAFVEAILKGTELLK